MRLLYRWDIVRDVEEGLDSNFNYVPRFIYPKGVPKEYYSEWLKKRLTTSVPQNQIDTHEKGKDK